MRCIGVCSSKSFVWWTISGRVFMGVAVYPGLIVLTRTPRVTHSIAIDFVMWMTPALEAL